MKVYLPKSFSKHLKKEVSKLAKVIEVSKLTSIFNDIYSKGELGSGVKEQSLILEVSGGVVVVTGCAHPV